MSRGESASWGLVFLHQSEEALKKEEIRSKRGGTSTAFKGKVKGKKSGWRKGRKKFGVKKVGYERRAPKDPFCRREEGMRMGRS